VGHLFISWGGDLNPSGARELRLCAAGGGYSKDAISAAAPLCGQVFCLLANGKCGKVDQIPPSAPKGYSDFDRKSECPLFFQPLCHRRFYKLTAQLRDSFILSIEPLFTLFVSGYVCNQFEIVQL
jgi:hypothetical protein